MTSEMEMSAGDTVEWILKQAYSMPTGEQLRRIGTMLVAHALMDVRLISVLVDHETTTQGGPGVLSLDDLRAISEKVSVDTFSTHLRRIRSLRLIPPEAGVIAEEINRARDHFVHFKVGRFETPRYQGQDITTDEGYEGCMQAILEFLLRVPFRIVGWAANP